MPKAIRVMAVYDEPIIIEGLRSIIGRTDSMVFVGAVASPDELFAALGATHCDVIIMDYVISDEECGNPDGLYLLRQIRVSHPAIRSILFTGWNRAGLSESAIAMGADAVLCKRDSLDVLTKTIQVLAGDDMRFASASRVHVGPPTTLAPTCQTDPFSGPHGPHRAGATAEAPTVDDAPAACLRASGATRGRNASSMPPAASASWSSAANGLPWRDPYRETSSHWALVAASGNGLSNRVTGTALPARQRRGHGGTIPVDQRLAQPAGDNGDTRGAVHGVAGRLGTADCPPPFEYLLASMPSSRLPFAQTAAPPSEPPYDALIRCPDALASTVSLGERGVWLENRLSLTRLSPRETEIVRLLSNGRSLKEVAAYLGRSPKTISNQKRSAMLKLGLHSDIDLLRFAIEAGLT